MFHGSPSAALFQVEHQHSDGTWATLRPEPGDPHDPARSDPEREWDRGHVFLCTSCQERVRVIGPRPEASTGANQAG